MKPNATMKMSGPDHPIAIESDTLRIIVSVGGRAIADTREALTLREAGHSRVHHPPTEELPQAAAK